MFMTKEKTRLKNYFINLIFPAFIFGSITGVLTALVVNLYKVCAKYVISLSQTGYAYLREHLYFIPLVLVVLFGIAVLFAVLYKKMPNLRGGGIPTSIGILRGIITFKWLRNLVGTFFLSLTSFLIGVPLGNEGPSVQMGTAIGRGSVYSFAKKHRAWDRYAMTGGACAGFAVATGAPISGIMFSIEEAHQRISPMIVIVSATSVMFACFTTELIAPLLRVNAYLFPQMQILSLSLKDIWLPVVIGLAVGLFAVVFLKYYRIVNRFFKKKLGKVPHYYKIFFVFAATLVLGLCSYYFISTGHVLILTLFEEQLPIYLLLLILLVRSTLTLSANSNSITGGIFLPILALGVVLAAILGGTLKTLFGLGGEYHSVLLALGIAACIAGMMKMPITAIVFSVEALSCYENILYVIVVSAVAFIITEIFNVKSVNDSVVENRVKDLNKDRTTKVIDTFVTVQKDSFAIGKQIRDIFWPANLFVLSLQRKEQSGNAQVDEHGGKAIREGDILHVRYSTYDEAQTKEELTAIVGEQDYRESETDVI